jgi:hypothetical protein
VTVVLHSVGVFRYSPTNNGSLLRRDGGTTKWWLVLDVDPELGRYFRHLFLLASYRTRLLRAPLWGTHISVIRNEVPPRQEAWQRLEGREVEFEYDFVAQETDGYYWLAVRCPQALDHREELGLVRDPWPPLHLTIGNLLHERT